MRPIGAFLPMLWLIWLGNRFASQKVITHL